MMNLISRSKIIRYLSDEDFNYTHITELFYKGGLKTYQICEMISFLELNTTDDLRNAFKNYYIKIYLDYHGLNGYEHLIEEEYRELELYQKDCPDGYTIDDLPLDELEEYLNIEEYEKFINRQYPQNFDEAVEEIVKSLDDEDRKCIKQLSESQFLFKSYYTLRLNIKNEYLNSRKNILFKDSLKKEYGIYKDSDELSELFIKAIWKKIR